MYKVFKGINYRVKFSVSELQNKVMFGVEILDNKYSIYTKFSIVGDIIYYGDDFWKAWRYVQDYIFNANLPKAFEKYILK